MNEKFQKIMEDPILMTSKNGNNILVKVSINISGLNINKRFFLLVLTNRIGWKIKVAKKQNPAFDTSCQTQRHSDEGEWRQREPFS